MSPDCSPRRNHSVRCAELPCVKLRTDVPGRHALQTVVADRRCSAQSGRDVRVVDDLALFGGVAPHAREAIRLQFQPDRKRIRLRRIAAREPVHLALDPEQFLHVVTYFVRQHVGLRELARSSEPVAQLLKESQVDVDLLILGAIKRSGCAFALCRTRIV